MHPKAKWGVSQPALKASRANQPIALPPIASSAKIPRKDVIEDVS
jgi:hypothetical protein